MFFFCRWKCVTIPQLLPFQHKCDINLTHLLPSRSSLFISSEKVCWGSGGFITHSRALPSKLPTICTIAPCRQWCSNCFHLLMKSCRSLNLRLLEEGPGKEPRRVWKVNEIHNVFKYVIISYEHNRTFCACIGDILYQNIHPTMTSSNTPRYISYASGIGHLFQYHPLGLSWVRNSTHFIPISKHMTSLKVLYLYLTLGFACHNSYILSYLRIIQKSP